MEKSTGDRTHPWGAPVFKTRSLDMHPPTLTLCGRSQRKALIQRTISEFTWRSKRRERSKCGCKVLKAEKTLVKVPALSRWLKTRSRRRTEASSTPLLEEWGCFRCPPLIPSSHIMYVWRPAKHISFSLFEATVRRRNQRMRIIEDSTLANIH
jgi:hypothetical protein